MNVELAKVVDSNASFFEFMCVLLISYYLLNTVKGNIVRKSTDLRIFQGSVKLRPRPMDGLISDTRL